jgi:hypothetical protein
VLGGDDLRAGGEVEVGLAGVAEPDAVAGAGLLVGGQVNGDGLEDAAAGGASVAGGGSADRAVRVGAAEGWERVGESGGTCAVETGECVQGIGGCWGEHVVLGALIGIVDLGGEPGGQDGEDFADGQVVAAARRVR